ncbi:MAG: 30S ribosomal protein S16 [Flavobacteriaceae bacterium]
MPVRIRLQRHGKKGKPIYWIVAADSRAKRDGRYLEKLGLYNPNTLPASVELNLDRAVDWLQKGAQPSHTARNLLSEQGAMLKNHLINGLNKGALTEDDVNAKFEAWVKEKEGKNEVLKKKIDAEAEKAHAAAIAAEKEVSIKRKEAAAAQAKAQEEEAAAAENENAQTDDAAAPEAPEAETAEPTAEPAAEAPAEETSAEEVTPAAEEQKEEAPAEETETAEPAAEAAEEEAAEEEAAEDSKSE